jgi:Ca2+-binding EF-hand superfamily protein
VRAMRDFLHSVDKQHTGVIPSANFMKVMRVFGIPAPGNAVINSHTLSNGMIEYDQLVEELANTYA